MGRDLRHFLLESLDRVKDRRTTHRRGATAIGATALRGRIGVSMHDQDVFDRNRKFFGDDLCEGRLLALTVWRCACIDHHSATLLHPYARTLIETHRRRSLGANAAD